MANSDKVLDGMQFALDAALEQLLAAQKAAQIVKAAQMEERDVTDDEMDVARNARREAVQRFRDMLED